jgi:hypothetical protein
VDAFAKFQGMTGGEIVMEILKERNVDQVFGCVSMKWRVRGGMSVHGVGVGGCAYEGL